MKVLLESVISIFLHPLAFVLALVNIIGRDDLTGGQKVLWAIVCILWGIGPILYFLIGGAGLCKSIRRSRAAGWPRPGSAVDPSRAPLRSRAWRVRATWLC